MRIRKTWSIGVLVAGLALVLACSATEPGVTAKVKAKFAADDLVKAAQIEVTTNDGIVTLTGNVDSEAAKTRALELAAGTTGVVKVVDLISARNAEGGGNAPDANRTVGETIDDAGITMNVKSLLLDDPLVKGLKIDVDTREGVVFLTGTIRSDAEKNQAIKLATSAKGVRDVKANLTLEKS